MTEEIETTTVPADAADESGEQLPAPKRDESGRWLPGQSANPKGKPRGVTRSEAIRSLLEPFRDQLVGRLLELTKNADPHAATRAVVSALEYIAPRPRPEPERIQVPGLAEAATLRDKSAAIVAAVANGEITPDAGRLVLQMLEVIARVGKIEDIEARIAALEGRRATAIEHTTGADEAPNDGSLA